MKLYTDYHHLLGNFQFIESKIDRLKELYDEDVYFDDEYIDYVIGKANVESIQPRKQIFKKIPQKRNKYLLKPKWNKSFKPTRKNVPYEGYQNPDEIDWGQFGPDRPTKKKQEYAASSTEFENSFVAKFSFFALLLPGLLGTLFFIGVPIAKVCMYI